MVRRCIVVVGRWGRQFVRMTREDNLKGGEGPAKKEAGKGEDKRSGEKEENWGLVMS